MGSAARNTTKAASGVSQIVLVDKKDTVKKHLLALFKQIPFCDIVSEIICILKKSDWLFKMICGCRKCSGNW